MAQQVWHPVGPVDDFPIGALKEVKFGRRSIVVVRTGDSDVRAFINKCPHQAAPLCYGHFSGTMLPSEPGSLNFGLRNEVIRCPLHGWEFHVGTGEPLFGTTKRRLKTYESCIRDGHVHIRMWDAAVAEDEEEDQS